mmetsp:Transcript_105/g.133  ORF Transcript_105/g.133 Transcript_105/m.133 type:complete len:221 (-) Transcript_105:3-665(-)
MAALSPCVELKFVESSEKRNTKFGGLPLVDEDFEWPCHGKKPLNFMMQIDFGEIYAQHPVVSLHYKLPQDGLIIIFADEDGMYAKVIYYKGNKIPSLTEAEEAPEETETHEEMHLVTAPALSVKHVYTWDANVLYPTNPDDFFDSLRDVFGDFSNGDKILGWPQPVGNEVQLEKGEVVLLQLGDSVTGWSYCGDGKMYWYMPQSELTAKNFENVTVSVDC